MAYTLQNEVKALEKQLLTLAAMVEENVQHAVKALLERDADLARRVVKCDDQVNRLEVDLEEECLKVLALHQPVANDLRTIIGIIKINNDLERIADQAVNISERALAVMEISRVDSPLELGVMSAKVIDMLEKALDSLVNANIRLARQVLELDEDVDRIHSENYRLFKDFVREDPESIDAVLNYLTVSRHLERVADLATNIAEDVIYLTEGEIVRHTIA
ncbi:MAG: phosphate transport system regulatory protein PhoU [Desulfuromonas sp.]|nr:MAG: phosphate transport system regulatory protein PhoU [Desulfuromonas sp.]